MTLKLTDRYASTLLKMEEAVGRNEYKDLAKEANLLWHQMESKNTFQEIINWKRKKIKFHRTPDMNFY